jgi:hypothetical protein
MAKVIDNLILENYDAYVTENSDTLFSDPASAIEVITNDAYFEMYTSKLMEGLEESEVKTIKTVLDRQRKMLIEEANSLMSSPEAIAYAVASFPMLINIYADPILQKIITVYPSDKPTMSISRLRWVAKVIDEKGNVQEYLFPTATGMIRPDLRRCRST